MVAIPVMGTVSAGGVLTAALWNGQVRDTGTFFLGAPGVVLRSTIAQTIATGVFVPVNWDTEDRDNDSMHSTVTNTSRITAVTPGWYEFTATIGWAGSTVGVRQALWQVNGATVPGVPAGHQATLGTSSGYVAPSSTAFLNTGDYLELSIWQNTGGNLVTTTGGMRCAVRWVAQ